MSIQIHKDSAANAIFIQDANGVQFLNSLQATVDNGFCSIHDLAKDIDIVSSVAFGDFLDQNGNTYGNSAVEVCDALNAIFSSSGTASGDLPNITSSLNVALTSGDTLNYELTADRGVGYEWDLSSVSGITTVEGNPRKLIGGSALAAGTYSIPVKAINYNGEDSETITLTVSDPPFANTKSVNFNNNDYLVGNAGVMQNVFGRTGNGSGSSDAWTLSLWFKAGTATESAQTIFYFGSQDVTNAGHIQLKYNGTLKRLQLKYGSNNNRLNFATQNNVITVGQWTHLLVSYDGGTTGAGSSSLNSYYSRFSIFIDGTDISNNLILSHNNFGYTGSILPQHLRIGRYNIGQNLKNNCRVDEIAVWDSDQSGNISDIYNSGTPSDLSTLTDDPIHWWPIDGSSFPNLLDEGSLANCTFVMTNMTSADIVSDAP